MQKDIDRKLLPPEFNKIILMGFDFRNVEWKIDYLDFKIESLVVEGPLISSESWYPGIQLLWLLSVSALVIHHFVKASIK